MSGPDRQVLAFSLPYFPRPRKVTAFFADTQAYKRILPRVVVAALDARAVNPFRIFGSADEMRLFGFRSASYPHLPYSAVPDLAHMLFVNCEVADCAGRGAAGWIRGGFN